jgi:hypothetical protein
VIFGDKSLRTVISDFLWQIFSDKPNDSTKLSHAYFQLQK